MSLQIFGQAIVVLGSLSAIKDLLDKHGDIYSDRPYWPVQHMCAESLPASAAVVSEYPPLTAIWHLVEWGWIGSYLSAGTEHTGARHER